MQDQRQMHAGSATNAFRSRICDLHMDGFVPIDGISDERICTCPSLCVVRSTALSAHVSRAQGVSRLLALKSFVLLKMGNEQAIPLVHLALVFRMFGILEFWEGPVGSSGR
eukprot:1618081-Pleurochrysis_carterae.AAC.1